MANEVQYAVWPSAEHAGDYSLGKLRTVVVDDSDPVLEAICALLALEDCIDVVATAQDGVEALHVAAEVMPDLVVMDINMPNMNGLQAAKFLTRHFPDTKIMLMSAEDSSKIREQCRASGVHGFAYKLKFREEFGLAVRVMFPALSIAAR